MRGAFLNMMAGAVLFVGMASGSLDAVSPASSDAGTRTPAHGTACREIARPELTALGYAPARRRASRRARRLTSG